MSKLLKFIIVFCLVVSLFNVFLGLFITKKSVAGAPESIINLFCLGLPPLYGICHGFITIFGRKFLSLFLQAKVRVCLLSICLLILSIIGIMPLLIISHDEYNFQLTCDGGACAQGGILTFLSLGWAWACYSIIFFINVFLDRIGAWPFTPKPDFSFPGKIGQAFYIVADAFISTANSKKKE
jgi:hypothetical protein